MHCKHVVCRLYLQNDNSISNRTITLLWIFEETLSNVMFSLYFSKQFNRFDCERSKLIRTVPFLHVHLYGLHRTKKPQIFELSCHSITTRVESWCVYWIFRMRLIKYFVHINIKHTFCIGSIWSPNTHYSFEVFHSPECHPFCSHSLFFLFFFGSHISTVRFLSFWSSAYTFQNKLQHQTPIDRCQIHDKHTPSVSMSIPKIIYETYIF